jgi:transglutaminase-like putative cysteine protease
LNGRRWLAAGILTLWFVVLGAHVRREYFLAEGERIALGARTLAPGTHFYVVRMNGTAIGTATMRLRDTLGGFVFDDNLLMDVPALDTLHRAAAFTRILMDSTLSLQSFGYRIDSKNGSYVVQGERARDASLDILVEAGGKPQRTTIADAADLLLDGVVPMRLAAAGQLTVGSEHTTRIFDPSSMSVRTINVRVTALDTMIVPDSARMGSDGRWVTHVYDTVPVWRIDQNFGGIALVTWVDDDGLIVRAQSPMGLELQRTTYEDARQDWAAARSDPSLAAGYGTLIESTAIASSADLRGIGTSPEFRVRLAGVELGGFDLSGGRQTLEGDTLTIRREPENAIDSAGYTLPYTGGGEPAAELGSELLVQSDDPRIRAKAVEITRGTTDPAAAARTLERWVYTNVKKEIVPGIPSALQTLEVLRGDCNEHTVLYVAMARAVGLPARTAAGLVHVRGRFYYHAWPEVWLNESWVAVDPTLGQYPADASHIRFVIGGLARQVELIRLIGRLRLEAI